MKRIMIAGTHSGCGKSTIICAVLQALVNRGKKISSFKCGPDYIDPLFHRTVIGTAAYNLDSYFYDENTLKYLFVKSSLDVSVIAGVMGFYDGIMLTDKASSYDIARITDTPVVLIVNAKGIGNSVGAVIKGFTEYVKNSKIKGVIFNGITSMVYDQMKTLCDKLKIKPLGYFPYIESSAIVESRHLGLITEAEIDDIKERLDFMAKTAESCIDIDGILELCSENPIKYTPVIEKKIGEARIAIAYDKAFCFYYKSSIELLEEMGAKPVLFSPMNDEKLPEDIDGIILGGGYPEMYTEELSSNVSMRESIKSALEQKVPCIAECGGFMYLHEKMGDFTNKEYDGVGVIPGICHKADSTRSRGYIEMTAKRDNLLCKAGESIRAHEFHYFKSDSDGSAFTARKGENEWDCIVADESFFAGFPHLHLYANVDFARNFMKKCIKYREMSK